jgi:hypothetical protein
MSSPNPSRDQIAFAYDKYLVKNNGNTTLAMEDLQTFILGYSGPADPDPSHPEMVLEEPAKVGEAIFARGMPWFAVVQRAMTEYAEHGGPTPTNAQIDDFRKLIESIRLPAGS